MLVRASVRLSLFKIFFIWARSLENPFSQLLEAFFSLLSGYFDSGSCQLRENSYILEGQSQADAHTLLVYYLEPTLQICPARSVPKHQCYQVLPCKSISRNPSACGWLWSQCLSPARVKPHQFPPEESACSHRHKPKSAWERPSCEETCWAEALFCPSLDPSLPRRLVLGTIGTLHPLQPFWGYRPPVLHSSNFLPRSWLLLSLRERINPLRAAKDADSRPDMHRGSPDSCLKEQLYMWTCGDKNRGRQGLFVYPRYAKAGSFPKDAWHISSPRYWILAIFPQTLLTVIPEERGYY